MARYIDANNINLRGIAVFDQDFEALIPLSDVRKALQMTSTADVQEVRHGRWQTIRETTDSKTTECTACMKSFFFMRKGQLNIDLMPYCPHCGAKMDGEREIDNTKRDKQCQN